MSSEGIGPCLCHRIRTGADSAVQSQPHLATFSEQIDKSQRPSDQRDRAFVQFLYRDTGSSQLLHERLYKGACQHWRCIQHTAVTTGGVEPVIQRLAEEHRTLVLFPINAKERIVY